MFEPQCEQRLLDLASKAALWSEEQVLGELLGDRAAALDYMAGRHIGEDGPDEPDRIDPEMAVEAVIFSRDDSLRQVRRHFLQGQWLPEKVAIGRQQTAVRRQNRDARTPFGAGELAGVGQGKGEIAENDAADDRRP